MGISLWFSRKVTIELMLSEALLARIFFVWANILSKTEQKASEYGTKS